MTLHGNMHRRFAEGWTFSFGDNRHARKLTDTHENSRLKKLCSRSLGLPDHSTGDIALLGALLSRLPIPLRICQNRRNDADDADNDVLEVGLVPCHLAGVILGSANRWSYGIDDSDRSSFRLRWSELTTGRRQDGYESGEKTSE